MTSIRLIGRRSIWIGANGNTGLYSWVNPGDMALALMSGFNAACCAVVRLLAIYKRKFLGRISQTMIGREACQP